VWDNFDRRQKARSSAANDADLSAEASAEAEGEGDMFSRAGVAAE
jgi:ribonucleoside-diphosphate reductase beta chain